jgi:cell wall-associated NlpC family hydrolase
VSGTLGRTTGTVDLDEKDLTRSKVDLAIEVKPQTQEAKRDAHLESADFFDTAKFPKATFKSKRVEKVSENQNSALQDFQEEQAKLTELERSTETETAQLKKEQAELDKLRTSSDSKIAESKTVLAKLTEEERQRIAAEEQKARQEAQAAAEGTTAGTTGTTSTTSDPAVAGSSKGAQALAFAKSQLGKPYRYASAGPNSYDCSGLTSAAWAKAGVSLPRTSQSQIGVGRSVSKSELQPGDLVFYYGSSPSHVALYAGNGQIVHAPRPGKSVEYASLDSMPFSGARRPG